MKKILFVFAVLLYSCQSQGQNPVESVFRKYADNEGFTSVSLSGDLLRLFNLTVDSEDNDGDCHRWTANVKELRVLVQDDEDSGTDNFYKSVVRSIERNGYEEFLKINKPEQDLIMLVRYQGNIIREFLVVGGGEDNLLIQVRGNMTRSEAKCFSDNIKKKGCVNIVASIH